MFGNRPVYRLRSNPASNNGRQSKVLSAEIMRLATLERRELMTVTGTDFTGTEGVWTAATTQVATFNLNGGLIGNNPGDFNATILWGDGTSSIGNVESSGANYVVKAGHLYSIGTNYSFQVLVTGKDGTQQSGTGTATIGDIPIVSTANPIVNGSLDPKFSVTSFFTDAYPGLDSGSYLANVAWGDGTTTSGTVQGGSGSFTVTADHTYSANGTFPVRVTLTRKLDGQSTTSSPSDAQVNDAAATPQPQLSNVAINAVVGTPFSGNVATFTDAYPSAVAGDYSAQITWISGVVTSGTVEGMNGSFVVRGSYTFDAAGSYPVKIDLIRTKGNGAGATNSTAIVTATAQPQLSSVTINAVMGMPFSGNVATFTDTFPGAVATDYSAMITWKPGVVTSGTVEGSNGSFVVRGSYTFDAIGSYPVKIDLTRAAGDGSGSTNSTANVTATTEPQLIGITFDAVADVPFTINVATFTDAYPGVIATDYVAQITWKPGVVTSGTVVGSNGSFVIKGSYAFESTGTKAVEVKLIRNKQSFEANTQSTGIVTAIATPQLSGIDLNAVISTLFSGPVATFTDALPNMTADKYTARIIQGSGAATEGVITGNNGNFSITPKIPLKFDSIGTFPLRVELTRSEPFSSVASISLVTVSSPPANVYGRLSPASDTGKSDSDGITNVNRPNFTGTAPVGSTVQLFVQWYGQNDLVQVGQGLVDSKGAWSIQTTPLVNGVYTIFVRAISPTGQISTATPLVAQSQSNSIPLVIDTVAPVIASGKIDRRYRRVLLSFRDNLSGMDSASVVNTTNYNLFGPHPFLFAANDLYVFSDTAILSSDPMISSVNIAPKSVGAWRINGLRILSGGVQDVAGNALDGEYKARFPTGNGMPGGLFYWKFSPAISNKPTMQARKLASARRK